MAYRCKAEKRIWGLRFPTSRPICKCPRCADSCLFGSEVVQAAFGSFFGLLIANTDIHQPKLGNLFFDLLSYRLRQQYCQSAAISTKAACTSSESICELKRSIVRIQSACRGAIPSRSFLLCATSKTLTYTFNAAQLIHVKYLDAYHTLRSFCDRLLARLCPYHRLSEFNFDITGKTLSLPWALSGA